MLLLLLQPRRQSPESLLFPLHVNEVATSVTIPASPSCSNAATAGATSTASDIYDDYIVTSD